MSIVNLLLLDKVRRVTHKFSILYIYNSLCELSIHKKILSALWISASHLLIFTPMASVQTRPEANLEIKYRYQKHHKTTLFIAQGKNLQKKINYKKNYTIFDKYIEIQQRTISNVLFF